MSVFGVAWGIGMMSASLYGYAHLGFSRLGFTVFLSGLFCFAASMLP